MQELLLARKRGLLCHAKPRKETAFPAFENPEKLIRYGGGRLVAGRVTHTGQHLSEVPDKQEYPGPPV